MGGRGHPKRAPRNPKPASRLPPPQPILSQLPRFLPTKVPRWYYLSLPVPVPTSSHRPCPQCARARPGTKTQGCGGRPQRTIATNAVRNTRYTQTRSQEGGGALVCCVTLQFAQQKMFALKNCALREIFFKTHYIHIQHLWVRARKVRKWHFSEKKNLTKRISINWEK